MRKYCHPLEPGRLVETAFQEYPLDGSQPDLLCFPGSIVADRLAYYQYFTNVERIPEKRGAERAYARFAPLFSDFFQLFCDLLIICIK
jgi:hypothetical protein